MKVKAGRPLIEVLKLAYASNQPVLLIGRHGVGKSELVAEAARVMGVGHIVRDLSLMEPPDLAGLPVIENRTMNYAPPSFLPKDGKGLLVFEELNRAQRYLQAPCLQLLTARKLNDYVLPQGWLPVAAINPADGGYHTDELDAALASRFLKVEVEPDVSEWLSWAKANGVDQRVCEYVGGLKVFLAAENNPRAWTYASRVLQASEKVGANEETLLASLEGILGAELALGFMQFAKGVERPLEAADIIERYQDRRSVVTRWKDSGKLDLVSGSLHQLETRLQSESNWREVMDNKAHLSNVRRFVKDLPGDLRRQAKKFFEEHGYILEESKP